MYLLVVEILWGRLNNNQSFYDSMEKSLQYNKNCKITSKLLL